MVPRVPNFILNLIIYVAEYNFPFIITGDNAPNFRGQAEVCEARAWLARIELCVAATSVNSLL